MRNKLMLSDMRQNAKLFVGTLVAVILSVSIISSCLALMLGTQADIDYGQRFSGVNLTVQNSRDISVSFPRGDKTKTKQKPLKYTLPLTQTQVESLTTRYHMMVDYTFFARPEGISFHKIAGHSASSLALTGFEMVKGREPQDGEVLVDADLAVRNGLALGQALSIQTHAGTARYIISGIVDSAVPEVYTLQNYLFVDEETAQTLGKPYSAGVVSDDAEATAAALRAEGYVVWTGELVNRAELLEMAQTNSSLLIIFLTMSALCLVVSVFVISGTARFSIKNRQRSFSQLRILGLTKRNLTALIAKQNGILCLLGGVVGVWLSGPMSRYIADLYIRFGVAPPTFSPRPALFWNLVAILAVMLTVFVVSRVTAHKTLTKAPLSGFTQTEDSAVKQSVGAIVTGFVFVGGGVSIVLFTPFEGGIGIGMGFLACFVFLLGALLLSPFLMKFINMCLSVFTRRMVKNMGQVAAANVHMKAAKFAVAAISIAIMISINAVMLLNNTTYMSTSRAAQYDLSSAYPYVTEGVFPGDMPEDSLGLHTVKLMMETTGGLDNLTALSVSQNRLNIQVLQGKREIETDEIMFSSRYAHLKVGDIVNMYLPNGERKALTVSGLFASRGDSFEAVVNHALVAGTLFRDVYDQVYSQQPLPSSQPNTLSYYEENPSFDVQVAATLLMTGISVLLSIIALFNTFALVMSVRRQEFHVLKTVGARRGQIVKMTLIETVIVTLTGLIIGMSLIVVLVGQYSLVNRGIFDFCVDNQVFWGLIAASFVLSLLSGMIPSGITIQKLKQTVRSD